MSIDSLKLLDGTPAKKGDKVKAVFSVTDDENSNLELVKEGETYTVARVNNNFTLSVVNELGNSMTSPFWGFVSATEEVTDFKTKVKICAIQAGVNLKVKGDDPTDWDIDPKIYEFAELLVNSLKVEVKNG